MKKFLLISYYWPPAGGAGVMRWAKMTKYIAQFGWQPVVYTPLNGEVPVHDESLLKEIPADIEVVKTPIWEPYNLYKKFLGRKKEEKFYSGFINEKKKASLSEKIGIFIRGNFFIPDARMFWIKPSIRFLKKYLKENHVDVIISTGPPHSMHMIAEKLHRDTKIPWIADFRDPWTNMDFYQSLQLTPLADAKHRRLEMKVLKSATKVIAASWRSRDEFKEICGRDDIIVIPNGFDEADFTQKGSLKLDEKFSIVYIGSITKARNPVVLWSALTQLLNESAELKSELNLKLIGPIDFAIKESISNAGLQPYTTFIDYVPHTEAVVLQQQAQVLLIILINTTNAKTVIPGKLYEYLGSGRPIIAISAKDGDTAKVIEMTKGGAVHEDDDVEGLKARIMEYFHLFKNGQLKGTAEGIEKFTRRSLAGEIAKVMDELNQT